MGKMPRKDYAGSADVAKNNETLKRVNTQNAPASLQATGHTLTPDRKIPMTADNIDAIVTGDRILDVSREKYVKTVNKTVDTVDSIVVTFKHEQGQFKDETYTRAELLASGTLFIAAPTV
jgi:hypothetical protein